MGMKSSEYAMNTNSIKDKENGFVMVEAIFYLPLVIATVVFLIYIALLKFQEAAFIYAIERTAQFGANEVAYAGYDVFSDDIPLSVNFDWKSGSPLDNKKNVEEYYKAKHSNILRLYHEIFGSTWVSAKEISSEYDAVVKNAAILSVADGADYSVAIKRGLLSTYVIVSVNYKFDTPGILQYLGLNKRYTYSRAACSVAINPAGFVRNVDLVVDVANIIAAKLDIDTSVFDKILAFMKKYL